jgi:hypothetical protein
VIFYSQRLSKIKVLRRKPMQKRRFPMQFLIAIILMVGLFLAPAGSIQVSAQEGGDESAPAEETSTDPTEEASAEPTEETSAEPTEEATPEPTEEATAEPTAEPTEEATAEPTAEPTEEATAEPTEEATAEPTAEPTEEATEEATAEPTPAPPVINSFVANPTTLTAGTSPLTTTLTWDVAGADSLDLNGEVVTGLTGKTVELTETTVFTLTASNSGGTTQAAVTVVVEAPAPSPGVDTAGDIGAQAIVDSTLVRVQNIGTANAPDTVIEWYNSNGTKATGCSTGTTVSLNQFAAKEVTPSCAPSGWRGSAVILSSQAIAAIAVTRSGPGSTWTNVNSGVGGSDGGEVSQFLPSIHANATNDGWNALIAIQNTGANANTVDITFLKDGATEHQILNQAIQPNGAFFIDTQDLVQAGDLPNNWIGAVRAVADSETIYAVAIEGQKDFTSAGYEGLGPNDGSTVVYMPSLHRNVKPASSKTDYAGWNSTIFIQNMTGQSNKVRVDFLDFDGDVIAGASRTLTLSANQANFVRTPDVTQLPYPWFGGGKVTSLDNREVTVIVNEWRRLEGEASASYSSYFGIKPDNSSTLVFGPSVAKNAGGWNSTILVQNLDGGSADIVAKFYNASGAQVGSNFNLNDVGPGGSGLIRPLSISNIPAGFKGGIRIESTTGQRIAVNFNEWHDPDKDTRDAYFTYNGFAQ